MMCLNSTLILVFCVLQIILGSSKKTGLTVVLKPAMCLQVRGDFPSRCFGTIRYNKCASFFRHMVKDTLENKKKYFGFLTQSSNFNLPITLNVSVNEFVCMSAL